MELGSEAVGDAIVWQKSKTSHVDAVLLLGSCQIILQSNSLELLNFPRKLLLLKFGIISFNGKLYSYGPLNKPSHCLRKFKSV